MKRRWLIFLGAVTALPAFQGFAQESGKAAPQVILFVCEHGAAKSVIAAAHFNRLASEKGLPYRAITRGVNPDQEIPSRIVGGLAGDGLDVSGWKPQKVSDADVAHADRVITLACSLPKKESGKAVKVTEWNDVPEGAGYEATRKAILDRVTELVNALAKK